MNVQPPKYLDFTQKPDFKDILTNPILDIAARFWEDDRYEAFKICYRSMRVIDDLVDDRKASGHVMPEIEKEQFGKIIADWLRAFEQKEAYDSFMRDLLGIKQKFQIPSWPWERLAKAMLYDLDHNGFADFAAFLRYTEGAAIAPGSIFMHLCGVQSDNGVYSVPPFDVRRAARPLAVFSYLVHIVRDFEKDQKRGLNYYADDILRDCRLTVDDLARAAQSGEITPQLRQLMTRYCAMADYYRQKARHQLDLIGPHLTERYRLSLEILYSLYSQIWERIEPVHGEFTASALNPSPEEIQVRIDKTIRSFHAAK